MCRTGISTKCDIKKQQLKVSLTINPYSRETLAAIFLMRTQVPPWSGAAQSLSLPEFLFYFSHMPWHSLLPTRTVVSRIWSLQGVHVLIFRTCKYAMLHDKGNSCYKSASLKTRRVNYPGRSNIITGPLKVKKETAMSVRLHWLLLALKMEGATTKKCWWPPKAGKGKKINSTLESPERDSALLTSQL